MRDHQFDWKQVYSLLDHINDLTKSMNHMAEKPSHKHRNVSSRRRSHARADANQLTASAVKSLQGMKNIDDDYKNATCAKIKHLNEYNQKILGSSKNTAAQQQLVKITKLQLRKIVAHAYLDDTTKSLLGQIQKASLDKAQKTAAMSEIESTLQYSVNNLTDCQKVTGVHNIVTSSINAMNGALVKYIVDSKIEAINQLNKMSRQISQQVGKESKLDSKLKAIANQAIESIRTQAVVDLMTQSNNSFKQLNDIKHRCFTELKHVVTSVDNLKDLEAFVNRVKNDIVVSVPLTVNAKFQLKHRIDHFNDVIINNFQGAYRYITKGQLNQEKCRLAIIVVKLVNDQFQNKITNQALDLSSDQRKKLADNIKRTAHALCQGFVNEKSRKDIQVNDLITSLNKLQNIMNERQAFAYNNQVDQLVKDAQLQIEQFSDFSGSDKHYLWILVANFGKSIQARKQRMSLAKVRLALQKLFREQVKYIENYSLKYQFEDLTHQIDVSHLSKSHTENLLAQLSNVQKNGKLNYSNKLLFLKTIQNYSMVLDQNQNLHRLSDLSTDINQKVETTDVLILRQQLEQNLYNFNQQIDRFNDILSLDHFEQSCENQVYQKWFNVVVHGNSIKKQKLADVMTIAKHAHHQVKLAILQSWLNHVIVDQIDQIVNQSVLAIGQSYDMDKIKAVPDKLKHDLKSQFKQTLAHTKQIYAKEIDRVVRDVQSRLVAYPAFKSVVGKIGLVRSRAMTRINNFADLLHVEHVKQVNETNLYRIVSHVVDTGNTTKSLAHQHVQKMVDEVKKELLSHKSNSKDVNLAFINRILLVQNHADACIDQDLNNHVEDEIKHCQKSLGLILRRHYIHRWSRIVSQSRAAINNLDSIATDVRQNALNSIDEVQGGVATKLGRNPINTLYGLLKSNQQAIKQITRQTVYRDPVKKHAFTQLRQLVQQTRQYVRLHAKGRIKKFILTRLTKMEHQVREQISICPDKDVKVVYQKGTKKIKSLHLDLVRGVKMRSFTELTNSITRQVQGLHFLADQQKHHFNAQFNRTYHKSIYDIKHSPDIAYCNKNEYNGKVEMNRIFDKVNQINTSKHQLFERIQHLIQTDRHLVQQLRYINPDDKANSDKLLAQLRLQSLKKIRKSAQSIQLKKIEKSSNKIAQQIVNEVSSANVLLAAIKSAEDLIAHSKLAPKQKKATMHQIKTIFRIGIEVQKGGNTDAVKHRMKANHPSAHANSNQKTKRPVKDQVKSSAADNQTKPAKAGQPVEATEQYRRHSSAMPHPIRNILKKLGKVF